MRRRIFFAAFTLPSLYAISLSNFQRLTSSDIPSDCQNAYNIQIPFCVPEDFTDSCSTHCITGLYSIAGTVSAACEDVSIRPITLLGYVQSGSVVEVLCPSPRLSTIKFSPSEIAVIPLSESNRATSTRSISQPNPHTTTLSLAIGPLPTPPPESNPSTSATATSAHTISSSLQLNSSSFSPTGVTFTSTASISLTKPGVSSTSESSIISNSSPSIEPTTSNSHSIEEPSLTSLFPTSSQSPSPSPSRSDDNPEPFSGGSGGGSPFDIQSRASNTCQNSLCVVMMALIWTYILQR